MRKLSALLLATASISAAAQTIVSTDAYIWRGDTIFQGPFKAYPLSAKDIISTYSAQPGYYMPIDKRWSMKNDLSAYPRLSTPNLLHEATYNMALDEMVNAVEPDTTLRTGKEWAGVWTRDVSYSIILSMAYMQPEASRISLEKKVDSLGRIIQDTGSGGAWPVSSDREIWAIAAYEVYKVTGDREWLKYIYPIIKRSLETDAASIHAPSGLVKGETSFIDWREQSHPKWMQTADVYNTETLSTSVVHAQAWRVLADIAAELGHKKEAASALEMSRKIADAVNEHLWMEDKGYYAMYRYGRDNLILNPRAETLGESLAILWDVADADRAARISASNPTTPFGTAIFYPQIADMPAYHNNALWPWVGSMWALAAAKAGNEQSTLEAIGSVIRPAALFATNKENFNLDNGDIATELNSSNMLWCLSGNIALTHKILFGMNYEKDGLHFAPFVPEALGQTRTLSNFRYRKALLDITVHGYGSKVASFKINGKEYKNCMVPASAKGDLKVEIFMDNKPIAPVGINRQPNRKAPLTPIVRLEGNQICWNPIEYIDHYEVIADGRKIAETHSTTFPVETGHEYQVIGVDSAGVPSFASEPVSLYEAITYQMPGEAADVRSPEVAYAPRHSVQGFTGNGFVETDKNSTPIEIEADVPAEGDYMLVVRYANGNGPVNTENKCGIRTLIVDGSEAGTIVLPQRGVANWDDWGYSNHLPLHLSAGKHVLSLSYLDRNENMNIATNHALIDAVTLFRIR